MSGMLPADAAIRERALDPRASFIVQAPAGSGKTELLTRRFLRLLAVVEQPEEILAITFTRKAAAEMRSRILEALELGQQLQPGEPHRVALWELARAALAADAQRGWRLLDHPARLKVQTIDAFNHTLARQLPILAGTGAAIQVARDSEPLYVEAVLRVIEHLSETGPVAQAIERLVRHLDNRLDLVTSLLTDLLRRRDHWLDLDLLHSDRRAERRGLRDALEQAIKAAVADRLGRIAAIWPADSRVELTALARGAAERLQAVASTHPLVEWRCAGFPEGHLDCLAEWRALAELLLLKDRRKIQWRANVDKNSGFPPKPEQPKQAMLGMLEQLTAADDRLGGELKRSLDEIRHLPTLRYSENQWQALDALLEVLKLAVAELELVFRERGTADHVAAALAGRAALGSSEEPTELALKLDYRLNHLLVDEFQDTSRSQIRLLRLLTAGWTRDDGRTLFLVGDPMQSIYRFREADVGLFLKLRQEGLGDLYLEPLTLTVNFRSHQPVVDWVNAVFPRVLPARDDAERGAVSFTPAAARPDAASDGQVLLHPLVGPKANTLDREGTLIAELVLDARRRGAGRIAVLVAARTHLTHILPALAKRGIATQAVEIDLLCDRPVVRDLAALTRALVHLGDRTAWLSILRAPWCGLDLADLHSLAGSSRASTALWTRIDDPKVTATLSSGGEVRLAALRKVMAAALDERGRYRLRDWVERAWHAVGGPATLEAESDLDDAEAYLARLDELERAGDLEDVARLETEIADLFAVPGPLELADRPPVEVMTLHKAKGLEFDIVILPALERTAARDDVRLLRWLELSRTDDQPALLVAPMAARDDDEDPMHAWLKRMERERAVHERARLLYVGATRAIRELHLIGSVVSDSDTGAVSPPATDSFLGLLWPQVGQEFVAATPVAVAGAAAMPRRQELQRFPADWQPPFDELPAVAEPAVLPLIEGAQPEFDWVSETGRHIGTLVHREIDKLVRAGLDAAVPPDEATRLRFGADLTELGVPEKHRAAAVERVAAALANLLKDERGRWLLQGTQVHREAVSELPLSGFVGRTLVNGVIDRTFVDERGVRWIVDFKTSAHSGAGLEAFLASEEERYRPQLARYAALMRAWQPEPVRAALYFPLLRVWREVDVD